MLVTYYDCYNVLTKVYSKGTFIKQAFLETRIEELNRSAVTKICYGVLDKDIELNFILEKFCKKSPKLAIKILLKIGIYSIKHLNTPPHLVTDTLVELCKKLGKTGVSGFLNAVLRSFVRNGVELPKDDSINSLSISYSCPKFIVEKLVKSYGLKATKDFLSYDEEKTYVRFNKNANGLKYLTENGYTFTQTPFENLFEVKNFKLNDDFYSGLYTFQSIGSVAICSMASGGETAIDVCSAPGGKAVLLADSYNKVTACDIHEHRVGLIKSYAERMGKGNVTAILQDGTLLNSEFLNKFDLVLCDVPCSGSGVMKDNPDIKLNRSLDSITEITKTQKSILSNAKNYVKVGGELIYSTCSILPEENDKIVENFLSTNNDFEAMEVSSKLNGLKTKYGVQFMPNISSGAGFYCAKLKRLK